MGYKIKILGSKYDSPQNNEQHNDEIFPKKNVYSKVKTHRQSKVYLFKNKPTNVINLISIDDQDNIMTSSNQNAYSNNSCSNYDKSANSTNEKLIDNIVCDRLSYKKFTFTSNPLEYTRRVRLSNKLPILNIKIFIIYLKIYLDQNYFKHFIQDMCVNKFSIQNSLISGIFVILLCNSLLGINYITIFKYPSDWKFSMY